MEKTRDTVLRARKLAPADTLLAEMWGEKLIDLAKKTSSPEQAGLWLDEADQVYLNIIPLAPADKQRATKAYFTRWRGYAALIGACRAEETREFQARLRQSVEFYERFRNMEAKERTASALGEWARDLKEAQELAPGDFKKDLLTLRREVLSRIEPERTQKKWKASRD